MLKIATVVGARPQFVKASMVTRAFKQINMRTQEAREDRCSHDEKINEIIIHTGQHYDTNLSQIFFDDLGLPSPHYNLGVGSATHGKQTGHMLIQLEEVFMTERPDVILTYGDTNSTLAGALAATKLHIPLVHVEAGLRSFNRCMPEEINRVLTDHVADVLFCPTQTAVKNLRDEGITKHVYHIGDVMYDAALYFSTIAEQTFSGLTACALDEPFYLATVHRQENTDAPERLAEIVTALSILDAPVIFPLHPRTEKALKRFGLGEPEGKNSGIRFVPPVSFLDMLVLEKHARLIFTDSGGVQKEAYFFNVPCITLRDETEWVETVEAGMNILTGACKERIIQAIETFRDFIPQPAKELRNAQPFGDGQTAEKIVEILLQVY